MAADLHPPGSVTPQRLRELALFSELDERLLRPVAAAARSRRLPPGPLAGVPPDVLCFLTAGAVRLVKPGTAGHRLQAGQPAAGYPLPLPLGWMAVGDGPWTVLELPERYLRLGHPPACKGSATLEIPAGAIEAAAFLTFYRALRAGRARLPSMPELILRIGEVIDDPDTVNQDIARVIQADPAVATNLIRVVNSAAYTSGERISTLPEAVARLGRKRVRNLVFSFILKNLFRTDSPALRIRMQQLWTYSCRVSAISFVLARLTPGLDPERALLAGLVHRIGQIPILNAARDFAAVAAAPQVLDRVLEHLESEIGELTLRQWDFDENLIHIARQSDDWMRPGWALPDYLDVVILAQLHARIGEPHRTDLPPIGRVPAYRKLAAGALSPRQSLVILDEAQKEIEEVTRLLQGR